MSKPVHEKMGIKLHDRIIFLGGAKEEIAEIQFPGLNVQHSLTQQFDHIILFVITQEDMKMKFAGLKQYLKHDGKLWIAWPKAKQLNSNLTVPTVIKIGYDYGMVESTNLSINKVWTALKFTWPKPGKVYNNSYGILPQE